MPAEFEEREKYILLRLVGEALDPDAILQSMRDAIVLVKKSSKDALVCRQEYSRQKATAIDFYGFSKFLEDEWPHGRRFAIDFPRESLGENIEFMETALLNRGLSMKAFDTFEEAEQWLLTK